MAQHLNLNKTKIKIPKYVAEYMNRITQNVNSTEYFGGDLLSFKGMCLKRLPDDYAENGKHAYLAIHTPKRIRDNWGNFEVHINPKNKETEIFSVM